MGQQSHKRDGDSLIQAWNAFKYNIAEIERDAWLDKLTLSRNGFYETDFYQCPLQAASVIERSQITMPLLGNQCQCCVNNLARDPKEAYSMRNLWWRGYISYKMYEEIDNLQLQTR